MKKHGVFVRTTKLNPPLIRSDIVARPRLVKMLEADVRRPLTLVSAPAGYGKSTVVAQWLESGSLPGVWLSLDEGDNDPRSFLSCLVAAVRDHEANACQGSLDLLSAGELPAPAVLADRLANELEEIATPFVLVLDDYHRVSNTDIHELLIEILDHPPRSLHLAVVTRHDPPFPMTSLRAKGLAIEIRVADLQFSAEETKAVFRDTVDIDLESESLARIMGGFEGWIVGLRLVCLALRNQEDPKAYLSGLSGDLSQIQEYLAEQVLARQTPEIQEGLVITSILDRFCPSLCDALCFDEKAVNPQPGLNGKEFIRIISEANLFTINLDSSGLWLRYHHLFRQVLRQLLETRVSPEEINQLHHRASQWFAAAGLVDEAIEHALAANDVESAADIIEQQRVNALNADQWPALAGWMGRVPQETVWQRPELLLGEAWLSYYRFAIPTLIGIVERLDELLVDKDARPAWVGELAMFKSYLCYWQGHAQAQEMLGHVATAQAQLPLTHDLMRADSEIYFGLAHHMVGQEILAIEALTHRLQVYPEQKGLLPTRRVITLAFIHLLSGNLKECAANSRQLGEMAWTASPVYITTWSMYLQGICHLQTGDWEDAERCFRWMTENRYVAHTATVMSSFLGLALALHYLDRAEDSADAAQLLQDFAIETKDPANLAIAASAKARLELLRGHISIPSDTETLEDAAGSMAITFIFIEVPVVTRCRLLIGGSSTKGFKEALADLLSLESAAENNHNTFQLIEILALKAVALEKLGRGDEAMEALRQTLKMAAPGEWVRPFVELGRPMAVLLTRYRAQVSGHETRVDNLLGLFDQDLRKGESPQNGGRQNQPLFEDLTNREQEVLELLAQRLYDKEIAGKLGVSVSTVKSHLRNLYQKLDAGNRRQAVMKAKELGLLQT